MPFNWVVVFCAECSLTQLGTGGIADTDWCGHLQTEALALGTWLPQLLSQAALKPCFTPYSPSVAWLRMAAAASQSGLLSPPAVLCVLGTVHGISTGMVLQEVE